MNNLINEHNAYSVLFMRTNPIATIIMELNYILNDIDERYEKVLNEYLNVVEEYNEVAKDYTNAKTGLKTMLSIASGIRLEDGTTVHKNLNSSTGNFALLALVRY